MHLILTTRVQFTNSILYSSTRNTRIERLWLEVGRCFARGWRAFFVRLGRLYFLEKDNPHHLWLLHYLFLPDIKEDCEKFQKNWNSHPISGKGGNLSPLVSVIESQISSSTKYPCRTSGFLGRQNLEFLMAMTAGP